MNRWTQWFRNAVTPTPKEISRVSPRLPQEVLTVCREATAPEPYEEQQFLAWSQQVDDATKHATSPVDTETSRLLTRLQRGPRPLPAPRRAYAPLGIAMVAVAVTFLILFQVTRTQSSTDPYGAPPVSVGVTTQLDTHTSLAFGPSIHMDARANIVLKQASKEGTVIALNAGSVHFDVDPTGDYRHLQIEAADVLITVKGTVFDVVREGLFVDVTVTRGAVEVRHNGRDVVVNTKESWSNRTLSSHREPSLAPPITQEELPSVEKKPKARPVKAPQSRKQNKRNVAVNEKPERTTETSQFSLKIPSHTQALHDIMTQREAGASLVELRAMIETYQEQHQDPISVLKALDILVQVTLENGGTEAAIQVLSQWITASASVGQRVRRKQHQYRWHRATLYRDKQNNCSKANIDYTVLAEQASEPLRSQSMAWMGLCMTDTTEKMDALRWLSSAQTRYLSDSLSKKVHARIQKLNATP